MNEDYRRGMEDAWKLALHAKTSGEAEDAIRCVLDDGMSFEAVLQRLKANGETMREMNWQPIETAPRDDETSILLCDEFGNIYTGRSSMGDWASVCECSYAEDNRLSAITHWMPLPNPPNLRAKSAES